MIGCDCAVCRSTDPRDTRLRPSIFVDVPGRARILVDTTPDLRQQALTHGISRVDAILFTHSHADHILGLDEMRRFNTHAGRPDPGLRQRHATWDIIKRTLLLRLRRRDAARRRRAAGGRARDRRAVRRRRRSHRAGAAVARPHADPRLPVRQLRLPDRLQPHRRRVVAAARRASRRWCSTRCATSRTPRTSPWPRRSTSSRRLGRGARYLTHMTHDLGHAATNARLPAGVELAYDGLVLDVAVDVE